MKTWRLAAVLAMAVSVSWTMPAGSQTLGLYDDFSSGPLDPVRWLGYEYAIGASETRHAVWYGTWDWIGYPAPQNVASMRRVVGGQAQIALTTYRDDPERGVMGYTGPKARSGLRINHPALADHRPAVTAFRATVTVVDASVRNAPQDISCRGGGTGGGMAHVELFGHFFNDGTTTRTDNLTDDVFARLTLKSHLVVGGVPRNFVEASIGRCTNADCSRIRSVGWVPIPGGWRIGVPSILTIAWQPASNAFVFTIAGAGRRRESRTLLYTAADQRPARAYAYDLRVETQPMLCRRENSDFFDIEPQSVSIDARFDDVHLDRAAAAAAR